MRRLALHALLAATALAASALKEVHALKSQNDQEKVLDPSLVEDAAEEEATGYAEVEQTALTGDVAECAAEGATADESEVFLKVQDIDNAASCKSVCNGIAKCHAAIYLGEQKVCKLLSALRQPSANGLSTLVLPNCDSSCFTSARVWKGTGTSLGKADNANFCQVLCQASTSCEGFSWNKKTRECTSFSEASRLIASSASTSGTKASCTDRTRSKNYAGACNQDYMHTSGKDMEVINNVVSFTSCQVQCLKNSECQWVDYKDDDSNCYLKREYGSFHAAPSGTQTGPKYCDSSCFFKNIHLTGQQIKKIEQIGDVHRCRFHCTTSDASQCNFWSYSEENNTCTLYSGNDMSAKVEQYAWTGVRGGCGDEAKYSIPASSCAVRGIKYTGQEFASFWKGDAVACQAACYNDSRCEAYSYNTEKFSCLLHIAKSVESREADSAFISGPQQCSPSCFKKGMEYAGTPLERTEGQIETAEECQLRCRANKDCRYFSFAPGTSICALHSTNITRTAEGFTSGIRVCESSCEVVGWASQVYDWKINETRNSSAECTQSCQKHSRCAMATYFSDRNCRMTDDFGFRAWRENPNARLGFSSCGQCFRQGVALKTSGPEYLYWIETQNADECQKRCDLVAMCSRFTYKAKDKKCEFFSGEAEEYSEANAISGPARCQASTSCFRAKSQFGGGKSLRELQVGSAAECQEQCARYSYCTHFNYHSSKCVLLQSTNQLSVGNAKDWTAGTKRCVNITDEWRELEMCYDEDLGFQPGTLTQIRGIASMSHCRQLCRENPRCRLWTLNVQFLYFMCVLMTIDSFKVHETHAYKDSGTPDGCPKCIRQYTQINGSVIEKKQYRFVAHCRLACELESRCKFFTYDQNSKSCTLMESLDSYKSAAQNFFSGPKVC